MAFVSAVFVLYRNTGLFLRLLLKVHSHRLFCGYLENIVLLQNHACLYYLSIAFSPADLHMSNVADARSDRRRNDSLPGGMDLNS
jgi:hypothetical protein